MIPAMNDALPYAGLKVVDLSQGVAGPYCAMMLAQYGADVVKVEPPYGDWIRKLDKRYGDHSAAGLANNRGSQSVQLGKAMRHASRTSSAPRNGVSSRTTASARASAWAAVR